MTSRLRLIFALAYFQSLIVAFPELERAEVASPRAFHVFGNQTEGFTDFEGQQQQSLFGRQACGAGYGQCGFTGECCPQGQGPNCCQLYCMSLRPQGTQCCNNYLCPPAWRCCGNIGNHCSPTNGVCCTADGRFCPENWSCCGNQGGCYPTKDFHCCSNDGKFCPNGYKCVYCSAGSTEICCQGSGGAQIPVYQTQVPTGNSVTSAPIPEPSTEDATTPTAEQETSTTSTTTQEIATTSTTSSRAPTQTVQEIQYWTTTYIYYYIYWTYYLPLSTVTTSTTTETTTFSVLASNRAEAVAEFSSTASSISSSAKSSASAARATITEPGGLTTIRETVTQTAAGGSGARGLHVSWGLLLLAGALSTAYLC